MRTHGWRGDPPRSDEEAVARIVDAAAACVRNGEGAELARVAEHVGVTRQTVYRYFPTRAALFEAVAAHAAVSLVARIAEHVRGIDDPVDAVVAVVVYCLRALPDEPQLAFVATPGRGDALITSTAAPSLADGVLQELAIDLGHLTPVQRMVLAEHMVRLLQALALDPSTATRGDEDLRRFLTDCLRGTVHPSTIRG